VLKTAAEIAKLKGVSRQAANDFILKNNVAPSGKKGKYPTYDTAKEPLKSYLAKRQKPPLEPDEPQTAPELSEEQEAALEPSAAAYNRIPQPINNIYARIAPGRKASEILIAEAISIARKNGDAAALSRIGKDAAKEEADEIFYKQALKTEQAKEQIAQERAERLRIENEIKKGGYLEKSTVKLIFGKQYAIDTSVLIPLGLKLADIINALPPSPDRRNKIQKLIDDEVFSALETKKRLLADFIQE